MPTLDVVALVLGLGIAVVAARLAAQVATSPDHRHRDPQRRTPGAGWLWAWLLVAPLLGVTWGGRAR